MQEMLSWETSMAAALTKARRLHNRKFPGLDRLLAMLETMNSDEIARELKVTRHTVTNWVRRHDLQHKALRIRFVREMERELRAERRRIAELEHVGKIEGGIAAIYAKKRMSAAEGINGWRWSRPFDCVL